MLKYFKLRTVNTRKFFVPGYDLKPAKTFSYSFFSLARFLDFFFFNPVNYWDESKVGPNNWSL